MKETTQPCRICASSARYLWIGKLIGRDVSYFECDTCGFVETQQPYWLEEAYERPINHSDTGIMKRNLKNRDHTITCLILLGGLGEKVIDFAGGYGILVRMLRDDGVDAWYLDPHCENLLAPGFEADKSEAFLATAFEVFEHFVDPATEIKNIFKMAPNVLLSTNLISDPAPGFASWWYYGAEHGQHVSFYREGTLKKLAEMHGKYFVSDGNCIHLFSDKRISKWRWKLFLRRVHIARLATKFLLKSKTWDDHLHIKSEIEGGK